MRKRALADGRKVKVGSKKNGSNSVPSLRLVPCITGTRLKLPLLNASDSPCGKIVVPAVGDVLMVPCAASRVATGALRRQAAICPLVPVQPTAVVTATPNASWAATDRTVYSM